jgi:hypothetical protein
MVQVTATGALPGIARCSARPAVHGAAAVLAAGAQR